MGLDAIYSPLNFNAAARGVAFPGFVAPPGVDQRQLCIGRTCHLALKAGDLLTIINDEGGAMLRLFAFGPMGDPDGNALGLIDAVDCGTDGLDAAEFLGWMAAQGRADTPILGHGLFDDATLPGEQLVLRAARAVDVWLGAPVSRDAVLNGGGAHFSIAIKRQSDLRVLPDPLGSIREEFTVPRATGQSYRIRKGEVVQIIDVEGRQCSDFMAHRLSSLDQGLERYIDSTVTRSLVGGAYPEPGLFDKFYDQDMRPLLNLVQDTVGRHDTFALACTERGYAERGFPGHVNCSDNISEALAPYGVAARRAWPAINFFFNSWISPGESRLSSDEAWSRAGDYVALRAMDDLVCVSTACPDDVDPINGWNPTDIHVRIYDAEAKITRATAWRSTEDAAPVLSKETAFHPRTSKLTQRFTASRDVWAPQVYDAEGALGEYWACRNAVTVQDMSGLRKLDILGPDAEALLQHAMTRNIARLPLHRGFHALLCDEAGTVVDDGTLFRIQPQVFRWCCGSEESGRHLRGLAETLGLRVWIRSMSEAMPSLAIQGPRSRDLLSRVVFTQPHVPSLETMRWFGCTPARLRDREGPAFLLTRSGYTGELGYEIFCAENDALAIWDALFEAGHDLGVKPMGAEALEMVRIEAGLMSASAEFAPGVDALAAGLGFAVDFKKETFVGREALQATAGAQHEKLVGLLFEGDEHPDHGDGVFIGERLIGTITSATRSPSLERAIAMARVRTVHAAEGGAVEVGRLDGRMKRLAATVCGIPFVDPTRSRARA